MKTILAIDTATESIFVALSLQGALTQLEESHRNQHTEMALPLIDRLLKQSNIELSDVDAIAFGAGPGAFTGLRVACGLAQGFGWALGKPLVAVSNLEALALREGHEGHVLAAIDARMGECYAAVYAVKGAAIDAVLEPPMLLKPNCLQMLAQRHAVDFALGSAFCAYADAALPEGVLRGEAECADACDIARLAQIMLEEGRTTSAALASPLYVRNRVALTIDERLGGVRL